jgi:hypothetical protein
VEGLTWQEWTSVLKLATMWQMDKFRELAITSMSNLQVDPIDKIVIATDYHISEWLLPALNQLAQREAPINVSDVGRLGLDCALKIAEVRESRIYYTGRHTLYPHSVEGPRGSFGFDFSNRIRTVFNL